VRLGRTSSRLPYAAARTAECYLRLNQILEAQALTAYISEAFRTDPDAADLVLKIAALISGKAAGLARSFKI
jgi:hypothetical protein